MQSKHYNALVKCDCGKQMRRTSIARHKKNSCELNQSLHSSSQTISKKRANIKRNISKPKSPSSSSPTLSLNGSTLHEPAQLISTHEHKIETTLRAKYYSNGTVVIEHDDIILGNMSFELKQKQNDKPDATDTSTNCSNEGNLRNVEIMWTT